MNQRFLSAALAFALLLQPAPFAFAQAGAGVTARDADIRVRGVILNEAWADRHSLADSVTDESLASVIPGVPVYRFPFVARPLDHDVLATAASNAGLDALRAPVLTLPLPSASSSDGVGEAARA